MSYLIGIGHDVALGSLVALDPQPRSKGVESTERNFSADGQIVDRGRFIVLVYDVLDPPALYGAILTQYGLLTAAFCDVTILALDETYIADVRWNGRAIRPAVGEDVQRENFMLRGIAVLVRDLVPAA